jgi:ADP-heptose:LPS heptosyltransferase
MVETQTPNLPPPASGGRLMILNIGRIGDTILRNSILDSALRTFATVDYICGRHNVELLRHDPRLNQVTVFHKTPAGFVNLLKAAFRRYDALIDLKGHPSSTSLIMAMLFRSRVKTGCNRGSFKPFRRDVSKVVVPGLHVLEIMRRTGRLAGLAQGEYKPSLFLPKNSIEWFRKNQAALDCPFIFLNISASNTNRVWPVANWARYVRGCGLADKAILINGSPKDREQVHLLCRELPGTVAFHPRCFMDVAAAVKAAHLVLTVETGVVHVCSALDKPIVTFYNQSDSLTAYEPLSTWRLVIRPRSGHLVPDIKPDEAVAETLNHGLPPPF